MHPASFHRDPAASPSHQRCGPCTPARTPSHATLTGGTNQHQPVPHRPQIWSVPRRSPRSRSTGHVLENWQGLRKPGRGALLIERLQCGQPHAIPALTGAYQGIPSGPTTKPRACASQLKKEFRALVFDLDLVLVVQCGSSVMVTLNIPGVTV